MQRIRWPLAVPHATYITNGVPYEAIGGRPPYMVFGIVLGLAHIRSFGLKIVLGYSVRIGTPTFPTNPEHVGM